MAGDVGGRSCTDSELLLHPELLSQEFLLLTLEQVGRAGAAGGRAGLLGRGSQLSSPQVAHRDDGHLAAGAPPAGFVPLGTNTDQSSLASYSKNGRP
jgi:hypothetical protein